MDPVLDGAPLVHAVEVGEVSAQQGASVLLQVLQLVLAIAEGDVLLQGGGG